MESHRADCRMGLHRKSLLCEMALWNRIVRCCIVRIVLLVAWDRIVRITPCGLHRGIVYRPDCILRLHHGIASCGFHPADPILRIVLCRLPREIVWRGLWWDCIVRTTTLDRIVRIALWDRIVQIAL